MPSSPTPICSTRRRAAAEEPRRPRWARRRSSSADDVAPSCTHIHRGAGTRSGAGMTHRRPIRLEDARSPPADGGQAAGVEIQLALASEGKHVAGLEEIKLRLERGGMEDFPPRPCQRKGGAWPKPLGKIQEKITVRRYGHPEAQRARRLIGRLEAARYFHGLGTVEDLFRRQPGPWSTGWAPRLLPQARGATGAR